MEKKKAQLILFGGRPMPNMLTIIDQKPDLVVPLISQDEIGKLPRLRSSITALFREENRQPELDTSYVVGAFDLNDIQKKCQQAIKDHPGYDWLFNITAATTVMSIGAYEVAKELTSQGESIRCWYLDTSHSNVVALIGETGDNSLFNINLDQYAAVYNCLLSSGTLEDQQQYCQYHWISFSRFLVQNPQYIDLLKEVLDKIKPRPAKPPKDAGTRLYRTPATDEKMLLLEKAYEAGLFDHLQKESNAIAFKLSYTQCNFLDGPWLEAYVWDEARKRGLFSDCRRNQKVIDENKPEDKDGKNELDVTVVYKSQLIVIECKTGDDGLSNKDELYKLDSVAGLLGGNFVGKMLVCSQPIPDGKDRNKQGSYQTFKEKADDRGIILVTREDLSRVGEILEELAKHPRRARG